MKLALSLIIIAFSGNALAQTIKVTNDRPEKGIKEIFYVLKSDKNIKDGPYAVYARFRDRLVCEGFYKNNVRDSIWTSYGYDGKLRVKYDYTNKKLFEYDQPKYLSDIKQYNVITSSDTLKAVLDQPPIFIDGDGKLVQLYMSSIRYPARAKEANIQGKVVIAVTIDTFGHVSNYRIKKPVGGGCSEEALRVVKMMEGDWLPGILNGKPVTSEYEIPVSFTLQQY